MLTVTVRLRFWFLAALALVLGLLMGTTFLAGSGAGMVAQPAAVTLEPAGHFGGWLAAIAAPLTGNTIYLGEGSGFTAYGVADKAHPRQVAGLPLPGEEVSGIALAGSTANSATVGGGSGNKASNTSATVAGGASNTADGYAATVGGGVSNTASGNYSFAAGFRAKALNFGSFVWADATDADFSSTTGNQFAVRATGGVRLETGGAGVTVDGNTAWHAGNDGAGSGLDADLLDGQHGTYYQARVSSSCAAGSSIRAIAADGTVTCETDDNTTYAAGNQLSLAGTTFNVVEGSGSGLDADLLDGWGGDYYRVFMVTSASSATTVITSTCRNYSGGQITITAPRAGVVVVEANVRMMLGHNEGTKDQMTLNLDTTTTDCYSVYDQVTWTIPAAYPTATDEYTFTVRRAFNVTTGAHTFYLNGMMNSGGAGDDKFWNARLHATFYPESAAAAAGAPAPLKGGAP